MLISLAVVLGGLSLYLNRDWFGSDNIQIYHRSRPAGLFRRKRTGSAGADNSAANPIVFGFGQKLRLTEVKVVPLSELLTNKYARPVWHLVSESNSVPIKDFGYGMSISGMHPSVRGATADPLQPGEKYRLFVEAGPTKAEHDFIPTSRRP